MVLGSIETDKKTPELEVKSNKSKIRTQMSIKIIFLDRDNQQFQEL